MGEIPLIWAPFFGMLLLWCGSFHLDHPLYDCQYLALARLEAAVIFTADKLLRHLAAQVLP